MSRKSPCTCSDIGTVQLTGIQMGGCDDCPSWPPDGFRPCEKCSDLPHPDGCPLCENRGIVREPMMPARVSGETKDPPFVATFTGRACNPLDLDPATVCIEDIAHALALKCRFTGHVNEFYSVAEHSCRCAAVGARNDMCVADRLHLLLHDAAEYLLPDVARPIKASLYVVLHQHGLPPGSLIPITLHERQLLDRIYIGLGLGALRDGIDSPDVTAIDNALLATEARDLMQGTTLVMWKWPALRWMLPDRIEPWSWKYAEERFLAIYRSLRLEYDAHVGPRGNHD